MKIKHAAVVAGMALGLMSGTAKAAYIIDVSQVGNDVFATGSGSINLAGASFSNSGGQNTAIQSDPAYLSVGGGFADAYFAGSGPDSFGSGAQSSDFIEASSATGEPVTIQDGVIFVPNGYVSGAPLAVSTSIFANQTFATLGVTPGVYTYTLPSDTVTVNFVLSTVPLPASAPMFGAALVGLAGIGYAAKRKKEAAAA